MLCLDLADRIISRLDRGMQKNVLLLQSDNKLATRAGQVVIPKNLRAAVLKRAHDQAGHYSHRYTLAKIQHSYTWPGIHSDVQKYCASCVVCNQANMARPKTKMPLERVVPPVCKIGDRLHIDLLDMPKSSEGHVAIWSLVDAATGFTIVCLCKTKTSESVVEVLHSWFFPYFGVPHSIVTDKGKENVNSEIQALTKAYNIDHIVSSTDHPQSNGMVERRQSMILQFFCKTCNT